MENCIYSCWCAATVIRICIPLCIYIFRGRTKTFIKLRMWTNSSGASYMMLSLSLSLFTIYILCTMRYADVDARDNDNEQKLKNLMSEMTIFISSRIIIMSFVQSITSKEIFAVKWEKLTNSGAALNYEHRLLCLFWMSSKRKTPFNKYIWKKKKLFSFVIRFWFGFARAMTAGLTYVMWQHFPRWANKCTPNVTSHFF